MCYVFSHDSTIIASGTFNGKIRLWDVATGLCRNVLTGHANVISALCFSHDSKLLASSSDDPSIGLWDVVTGVCKKKFMGGTANVVFSHDSQLLASVWGQTITIFDVKTETRYRTMEWNNAKAVVDSRGHLAGLLEFLDNSRVLAVSGHHEVKFWDVATGTCINSLNMGFHPQSMFFTDGSKVLVTSRDSLVNIWDVTSGTCVRKLELNAAGVVAGNSHCVPKDPSASFEAPLTWFSSSDCMAFSPNLKKRVLDASGHLVTPWMAASNYGARVSGGVKDMTFSHDSKTLAVRTRSFGLEMWGVAQPGLEEAQERTSESLNDAIFNIGISPNLKLLALAGILKLRVQNIFTNTTVLEYPYLCRQVAFSSDSGLMAVCFVDDEGANRIGIWDVVIGGCVHIFDARFESEVSGLEFSYDRRFLAGYYCNTAYEYTFLLLDLTTWASMPIFESEDCGRALSTSFIFSRDSELLALAHSPRFVGIRRMTTGTHYTIKRSEYPDIEDLRGLVGFLSNPNFMVCFSGRNWNFGIQLDIWNLASRARVARIGLGQHRTRPQYLEENGAYLRTQTGTFVFNPPILHLVSNLGELNAADHLSGLSIERRGIGLADDDSWITWNSHRILRLPSNRQPWPYKDTAITDSSIIFSTLNGNLVSIGFDLTCDLFHTFPL